MSVIRFGDDGFEVYAYFDCGAKTFRLYAPKMEIITKDFNILKAVVGELIQQDKAPADLMERIARCAFGIAIESM